MEIKDPVQPFGGNYTLLKEIENITREVPDENWEFGEIWCGIEKCGCAVGNWLYKKGKLEEGGDCGWGNVRTDCKISVKEFEWLFEISSSIFRDEARVWHDYCHPNFVDQKTVANRIQKYLAYKMRRKDLLEMHYEACKNFGSLKEVEEGLVAQLV